METHLPDARKSQQKRNRDKRRFSLHVDGKIFPIEKMTFRGFALDLDQTPLIRGFVEVFDGAKGVFQCLVIHSEIKGKLRYFEYKRYTPFRRKAPLDYAADTVFGYLLE